MTRLTVVGDTVLDVDVQGRVERVCPDAPAPVVEVLSEVARPGGAGLAAVLAAGAGMDVTLVTALGGRSGRRAGRLLEARGVEVLDVGRAGPTPEKRRVRVGDHLVARLDRGGAGRPIGAPPAAPVRAAVDAADAVLVSDYGGGVVAVDALREVVERAARQRPLVWDPHPTGPAPVPGAWLVTPNEREAHGFVGDGSPGDVRRAGLAGAVDAAGHLVARWRARGVVVTRGEDGAVLATGAGPPLVVAGRGITGAADTCGAGDRFASAAAEALGCNLILSEAVEAAVAAAGHFVGRGGAAALAHDPAPGRPGRDAPRVDGERAAAVVERVRAAGGIVVATGGCFDVLHAGHVELLRRARALGDALVVCLNSDSSVRRLKGDGRPIVPVADRVRVLRALADVDAVAVFDDDTPEQALEELRPDVFVKGGDYEGRPVPEQDLVARWGGVAVTIPYVPGRSTTRLIREVHRGR